MWLAKLALVWIIVMAASAAIGISLGHFTVNIINRRN